MLEGFGMVTYAVEPARLTRLLPAGVVADERAGVAFVSAVPFFDRDFAFRGLPFVKVSCGQVDYRAYVRRGAEHGVWFFGTSLDSAFVQLPRAAWRMPWHHDRLRIDAEWEPDGASRAYRLDASGPWGAASLRLRGTGVPACVPACFADECDFRATVLDPLTGWYERTGDRGVGRYTVWHEPLELEEAIVDEARFQVFDDLDLLDAGQAPLTAGVQRSVPFDVHTPPTRER